MIKRLSLIASLCAILCTQYAAMAAPSGKGKPAPEPAPEISRPCETGDPRGRTDCFGVSGSTRKYLLKDGAYYYYAGTIGALVQDQSDTKYMLSNNHVFAQENGNGGTVVRGDAIIQPGNLEWYYDADMKTASIDVGRVFEWKIIVFGSQSSSGDNLVDAAIAEFTPQNALDPQGRILGIGPINPSPVSPEGILGKPVHKAGRTTGHTWGQVVAVHVDNVAVAYDSGTAYFDDQIYVANQGSCGSFSAGGDSGSLILSGPDGNTGLSSPVALLFAGGSQGTFGNTIGNVLASFDAPGPLQFVACSGDCSAYATTVSSCLSGGSTSKPKGRSRSAEHMSDVALAKLQAIKARHRDNLSAIHGVTGVGIAQSDNGQGELAVFVESIKDARGRGIPERIEEVDVRLIETGIVRAY